MKIDSGTRPIDSRIVWIMLAIAVGVNVFLPPFDGNWTARILILAACVIVPLGLQIVSLERLGTGIDQFGRIARICAIPQCFAAGVCLAAAARLDRRAARRTLPGCNRRRRRLGAAAGLATSPRPDGRFLHRRGTDLPGRRRLLGRARSGRCCNRWASIRPSSCSPRCISTTPVSRSCS